MLDTTVESYLNLRWPDAERKHTQPKHIWFMPLTLAIILMFMSSISADICFCINIPKLTSCFPLNENAMTMCVCSAISHTAFAFTVARDGQKCMNLSTYVRQFVSSPQKDAYWKKHMVAMCGACCATKQQLLCTRHWNVPHNCKLPAPSRVNCMSRFLVLFNQL